MSPRPNRCTAASGLLLGLLLALQNGLPVDAVPIVTHYADRKYAPISSGPAITFPYHNLQCTSDPRLDAAPDGSSRAEKSVGVLGGSDVTADRDRYVKQQALAGEQNSLCHRTFLDHHIVCWLNPPKHLVPDDTVIDSDLISKSRLKALTELEGYIPPPVQLDFPVGLWTCDATFHGRAVLENISVSCDLFRDGRKVGTFESGQEPETYDWKHDSISPYNCRAKYHIAEPKRRTPTVIRAVADSSKSSSRTDHDDDVDPEKKAINAAIVRALGICVGGLILGVFILMLCNALIPWGFVSEAQDPQPQAQSQHQPRAQPQMELQDRTNGSRPSRVVPDIHHDGGATVAPPAYREANSVEERSPDSVDTLPVYKPEA